MTIHDSIHIGSILYTTLKWKEECLLW